MKITRSSAILLSAFMLFIFAAMPVSALTYFNLLVDGVENSVQIQGQPYNLVVDCAELDTVYLGTYWDLNADGILDPGEPNLVGSEVRIVDNAPPGDGAPFWDGDPTNGVVNVSVIVYFFPGNFIFTMREGTTTMTRTLEVQAPAVIENSVSGSWTFEGVPPPDARLAMPFIAGQMSPPNLRLMYFFADDNCNFSFNWPFEAADIMMQPVGSASWMDVYPRDSLTDNFHVEGNMTGYNHLVSMPTTPGLHYINVMVGGSPTHTLEQGQPYSLMLDCAPGETLSLSLYHDLNDNGVYDPGEPDYFMGNFRLIDNASAGPFRDVDSRDGFMQYDLNLFPDVGNVIFGASSATVSVYNAVSVTAPATLPATISGQVILEGLATPSMILNGLTISAVDMATFHGMIATCDAYGNFNVNWPWGPVDLYLMFLNTRALDPGWLWGDARVLVHAEGTVTGVEVNVAAVPRYDTLRVNFTHDPDNDSIRYQDIRAICIDPTTLVPFDTLQFPYAGPPSSNLVLPSRDCGIYFDWVSPEGALHAFFWPKDTIWYTVGTPPANPTIYTDNTNVHLVVNLTGFPTDSVPLDGIPMNLRGFDDAGHDWTAMIYAFVVPDSTGTIYSTQGNRELSNGTWTLTLPEMLMPGYYPLPRETTFTVNEIHDWPHITINIYPNDVSDMRPSIRPENMRITPNPFRDRLSVEITAANPVSGKLDVVGLDGRIIATIYKGALSTGLNTFSWEASAPAGVYFFRWNEGEKSVSLPGVLTP